MATNPAPRAWHVDKYFITVAQARSVFWYVLSYYLTHGDMPYIREIVEELDWLKSHGKTTAILKVLHKLGYLECRTQPDDLGYRRYVPAKVQRAYVGHNGPL